MNELQALILGMVQGLTEFLPVSSSGHLLVLEKVFGIASEGDGLLTLNVLMHLGTLLAVFMVYWERILDMILHPIKSDLKWLILATIPATLAALFIDFDDAFQGAFLGWSFWLTSVVLVIGDLVGRRIKERRMLHRHIHCKDAVIMGVAQAVAILPGLSRSGSTISGGVISGLSRRRAADFSFLMSIPAILGSALLEGLKLFKGEAAPSIVGGGAIVVGVISAAVFGFLAIKLMLAILKKINMKWFALYTFILGSLVLLDKYFSHLFF